MRISAYNAGISLFARACPNRHTGIRTYIDPFIHTCIQAVSQSDIHTYIQTYMHTGIHAYIHTCGRPCIHTYRNTYTHMHWIISTYYKCISLFGGEPIGCQTYIHTHTYIQTCTHTYIHTCIRTYIDIYTHT